jgi:hypothetical protein
MAPASSSTAGWLDCSSTASAIGIAARWCSIMSRRNSSSASWGGSSRRRFTSSGEAIPGHPSLRGVPHPGHRGLRAGGGQSPYVKPAQHHPYLSLLGEGDVGREDSDLLALGPVAHDLGHLHGLGVVHDHIPGETCLGRAVAGWSTRQVQPDRQPEERDCGHGENRDEPRISHFGRTHQADSPTPPV